MSLPPLPEPAFGVLSVCGDTGAWRESERGEPAFDADQLRAYAAQAVLEEREACARVCEERATYWQRDDSRRYEDESAAAAIRARSTSPEQEDA